MVEECLTNYSRPMLHTGRSGSHPQSLPEVQYPSHQR
jgi:hypothetical protein